MAGIGAKDPQALDLALVDALDNLVVGDRWLFGHEVGIDADDIGKAFALRLVREVAAAEQAGGVGEEAGSHGIALSGDGVAAGAGLADVAGHEGQVHDSAGSRDCLVTLVDAHGPPEGHGLAGVDHFRQFHDAVFTDAGHFGAAGDRESLHELLEFVKLVGVCFDEFVVDPVVFDQDVGQGVHEGQVGTRTNLIMVVRVHGCLGSAGINDYDLVSGHLVLAHAAPDDRMGDDRVGADEDQGVGELQIL